MKTCRQMIASCLMLTTCYILFSGPVVAQNTSPESLRLPEVVITGVDQSKIQREIPKVSLQPPFPLLTQSSYDISETFIHEGDKLYMSRPQQAEKYYIQAVTLDPTNSYVYLRLGDIYRALNQYPDAIEAYQKALDVRPNLPEAHYKLGMLYENQPGNIQKAIEHYRSYLQLGGSDKRVHFWLQDTEQHGT